MKKDRSGGGMPPNDCVDQKSKEQEAASRDKARRAQFARAIAKSEFGRYYWDERRESEPRHRKPKA